MTKGERSQSRPSGDLQSGWVAVAKRPEVTHPKHYAQLNPEPIDVAQAWGLNFDLGNVVKYVGRAGRKEGVDALDDLLKAHYYLEHHLKSLGVT